MDKSPRRSIISHILLMFVLFNAISLLVFTCFVIEQDRRVAGENAEASLQEIVSEKASLISLTLSSVARETENLAWWAGEYIANEPAAETLSGEYVYNQDGVLHRRQVPNPALADSRSNIFFPAAEAVTAEQIRLIQATERLDRNFVRFVAGQPAIRWVYIATEDGLLRCYPYDELDYEPAHQQREDHFYYAANEQNNPQRQTIWTFPYTDFLGTGWMVSCSHPVYVQEEFVGVVSSDVRIETLERQFLYDLRLGGSAKTFLLNANGDIIYHPDYETEEGKKGQLYLMNIFADGSLGDGEAGAITAMLAAEQNGLITYQDTPKGREMTIAYGKVMDLGWTVGVEIDRSEYFSSYYLNSWVVVAFFAIMILTLLALAGFLYRQVSRPMGELVTQAEQIAEGRYELRELADGYREIHTLSEAFNVMSQRIKAYTDDLRRKNKEIESVFNSIRGLLMILDEEGQIVLMNRRGALGQEPLGQRCYQLLCGRQEPCANCCLPQVFQQGEDQYCQIVRDGRIFLNSYFPVFDAQGRVVEVVVYSVDTTERVLLEKQLQQGEKMAGIGQISTAIAHELKNPLAVIKGSAYLLKSYQALAADDECREVVHTIWEAVAEAEQVIFSLLDFCGQQGEARVPVDVTKIIGQLLLLSNHDCIKQGIEIATSFAPSPLVFTGNREAMKSILQNLINNAIHALKEGGTIAINGCLRQEGARQWVEIRIQDDGPGMSEAVREKIYQPFFTTDNRQGTGLGLWITKMLVEKMDGTITVDSEVGKGTEFRLVFPFTGSG